MADIYRTVERSPYVSDKIKATLKGCTRQLEAECSRSTNLAQLVQRAANDSANVLRSRIHFLDALDDRINELSQLRTKFIDSRRQFQEQPNRLLAEGIQDGEPQLTPSVISQLIDGLIA